MLETISKYTPLRLEITNKDFGGAAIDSAGDPLPEDTLKSCKEADAILLGESGRVWDVYVSAEGGAPGGRKRGAEQLRAECR